MWRDSREVEREKVNGSGEREREERRREREREKENVATESCDWTTPPECPAGETIDIVDMYTMSMGETTLWSTAN